MKIVILAGGTGSIALQTGLYHELEQNLDGFDVKVIVNAYDNGLSTGAVRQVMDGKILGPSDVRKNQTTRLALENPKSPWLAFLNIRFTEETSTVENFCKDKFSKLAAELVQNGHSSNGVQDIYDGIDEFFRSPIASRIDYNDFSLANIIYAGLARANGNSLRKAASIMAKAMGIKDNVLLNDDTSLFLGAITKSGKRITDEGDIVSWGNMEDPFVDLFFTDAAGNTTQPTLCPEAQWAIKQADLIILSTGTQWSSLIPTYASVGFRETIEASSAQILMVMNRQPDHDSPGQTASEIVNILVPKYFPANRLKIIADATGHANMLPSVNLNKQIVNWYSYDLSREIPDASKDRIHDSTKLAKAIATTFFSDYLNSDYFVFDYDDTLVGRGNVFPVCSKYNINSLTWLNGKKTHLAICSGNSIKALQLKFLGAAGQILNVYADGGVNLYEYPLSRTGNEDDGQPYTLVRCVDPSVLISDQDVTAIAGDLAKHGITRSKIENRGNTQIAIKPIDPEYRGAIAHLIRMLIDESKFDIRLSGRTTIEISKKHLSKVAAIKDIIENYSPKQITYVGDEFDGGNDAPIMGVDGVCCLNVRDPADTAFFFYALNVKYS